MVAHQRVGGVVLAEGQDRERSAGDQEYPADAVRGAAHADQDAERAHAERLDRVRDVRDVPGLRALRHRHPAHREQRHERPHEDDGGDAAHPDRETSRHRPSCRRCVHVVKDMRRPILGQPLRGPVVAWNGPVRGPPGTPRGKAHPDAQARPLVVRAPSDRRRGLDRGGRGDVRDRTRRRHRLLEQLHPPEHRVDPGPRPAPGRGAAAVGRHRADRLRRRRAARR